MNLTSRSDASGAPRSRHSTLCIDEGSSISSRRTTPSSICLLVHPWVAPSCSLMLKTMLTSLCLFSPISIRYRSHCRASGDAKVGSVGESFCNGSTTSSAMSLSFNTLIVFLRFFSPSSPRSSMPAVSKSLVGPMSCSSIRVIFVSAVVPGVASTIDKLERVNLFMSVDLPAFMAPKKPMLILGSSLAPGDLGAAGDGLEEKDRLASVWWLRTC
mmetsp:Transcript_32560/g.80581  ORF Transcript_32560/g.80581 Transcript_32560/m.80581 type:complete len:214 (-) Transcript_32560:10-651(-)